MQNLPNNIPGMDVVADFVREILLPPAAEIGQLLTDPIRSFRFNNQIKVLLKAKKKLRDSGVSPAKVSLKVLVPLLDGASLEENDEMTEQWANLLAAAADPNEQHEVTAVDVETLRQLSPNAALVLYDIYKKHVYHVRTIQSMTGLTHDEVVKAAGLLRRLSLINLEELSDGQTVDFVTTVSIGPETLLSLNEYATEFVAACTGEEPDEIPQ